MLLFLCVVDLLVLLFKHMDQKYSLSVAILAVVAFGVSAFSLGQVIGVNGSVQVLSATQESISQDAAVARRTILGSSIARPGAGLFKCQIGQMTIITSHPTAVQTVSYNTGSGPTETFNGGQIAPTCVPY